MCTRLKANKDMRLFKLSYRNSYEILRDLGKKPEILIYVPSLMYLRIILLHATKYLFMKWDQMRSFKIKKRGRVIPCRLCSEISASSILIGILNSEFLNFNKRWWFLLWRVEFFKIGERDFMLIREIRVPYFSNNVVSVGN